MKKLAIALASLLLVTSTATAQFQQMVEVHVKPGSDLVFEEYMKKVVEGANKVNSAAYWNVFSVAVGKQTPTYRIGLGFSKWGERDAWSAGPRQILTEAFGEEEGTRIYQRGASAIEKSTGVVWRLLDDMSANLDSASGVAPFYQVTIRWVDPSRLEQYRGLLRRFKSAYDVDDSKPIVSRWVLHYGNDRNTVFRRSQPFDSWADLDAWDAAAKLGAHFGPDWPLMLHQLRSMVHKEEFFVVGHRPDLSRPRGATTSNE